MVRELRRMKEQADREEFGRFEAVHGREVWDEVFKARREVEGNPNWMEGMCIQNQVRGFLREQFRLYMSS